MGKKYQWILAAIMYSAISTSANAGYITTVPDGEANAPVDIYKTENVTGPMQTNDWWSNVAWQDLSTAAYPHPLAMQHEEEGLRIYYPGNRIYENGTYTIASVNDIHDFTVGHSNSDTFSEAKVDGFSDWFVTTKYESDDNSITASFGHGSPYVYFLYAGGNPELSFYTIPKVWYGDENSPVLGITMEGAHYALFGPTGSTWTGINSKTLTNLLNGKDYFSVAVLPDASEETLLAFQKYAYSFVTNTQVDWQYNNEKSEVTSTFTYTTEAKEGDTTGTIMSLYPHQWRNSNGTLLEYTYPSIRGTMKTIAGHSFTTSMTFNGLLPALPNVGSYDINTLASYVDEAEAENYNMANVDTYWIGKRLGKLAVLAPIADQVGDTVASTQFRDEIKSILEEWFTPTNDDGSNKSSSVFYYNENWGTLIGYPDSYGSSYELNDHHFHYGYFIKAAAEIARVDSEWAEQWGEMVELLIRDIASNRRDDNMFPFMRNFDPYAGHSWASGKSPFADGNNNESSSEGMNAWAGIIQWAELTDNTELRDFAIYLYTTEMNGINEYWFDVTGENFPESYTASTASMVWGAKTVGNAVWWSDNTEEIHGINWLPFTAGSLYLTHHTDYAEFNYQTLVSENDNSEVFSLWYDLILMYRAISDASGALNLFKAEAATLTPETGNSKANIYHWIGNLAAIGTIDNSITANYPFYSVFNKDGVITYVVYNMSNQEVQVTFSNGYSLTAPTGSFTVNDSELTSPDDDSDGETSDGSEGDTGDDSDGETSDGSEDDSGDASDGETSDGSEGDTGDSEEDENVTSAKSQSGSLSILGLMGLLMIAIRRKFTQSVNVK
ncbi:glycosyl hydrolase [Psychromonas sp.]|nr:glycosyl hydrolase [Psychromonas sp.]